LTKTIAIIALTCCLIAIAAAASIVGRDSVPAAQVEMLPAKSLNPVANRESKQDKLAVTSLPSAFGTAQPSGLREPLRQAYAASSAADLEAAAAVTSALPASSSALDPVSLVPRGLSAGLAPGGAVEAQGCRGLRFIHGLRDKSNGICHLAVVSP